MFPFVLVVLLLCNSHCLVSSLSGEGYALLQFKQGVKEDPEGSLSNWNYSDETPCAWNGITCIEQRVVSVSIPKKKLYGFLPSALGALYQLRHVNLRNNKFFGSLPVELLKASGLQSLVLYGNSLSGSVPSEIGNLKYLQTLDLSQNFFNGSLPSSIIKCRRLKTLDLSQNNLTGSLPEGFGASLISLEKLDLSFNKFNGSIPSDMGNLSSLQGTVDLSHNHFSGSIPSSLGNLPEKVYIDLTYNNLSGPIPQNGALMNRGPTAFIGNPGLCGPPLKNPCSSDTSGASSPSSIPFLPDNYPPENSDGNGGKGEKAKGLSKSAIVAIVVSDVIGICLLGLLFSYCYTRVCACSKGKEENGYGFEKGGKGRKECLCFRKDESETLSDNVEQYDLVPLDAQVAFDLDELLKASAFVLGKSGIGIVYKVVLEDGLTLAVRRLGEGGSQRFKEFQTEVEAIGKLRHPNIVALRAYYWSVDEKLLIYDYIPNGNLATAIHGKPGGLSLFGMNASARIISASKAFAGYFTPYQSSYCLESSLNSTKARGKVLVCRHAESSIESKLEKSEVVKEAGGVGMILVDEADKDVAIPFGIPAAIVGQRIADRILSYVNQTRKPVSRIFAAKTILGSQPAPRVAGFSSKGPNALTPEILKPDITAPGLNILAAWSPAAGKAQFNILSGTSMACPHVTGIATLIKAVHPSWTSSAIKSAIMTTATILDTNHRPIVVDPAGRRANSFDYGSGFMNPTRVLDPGLVYDAESRDYVAFLCSTGYDDKSLRMVTRDNSTCHETFRTPSELNYPSITVPNLREDYSVTRTVTNVGRPKSIYEAIISSPIGINVSVVPKQLIFNHFGQKIKFTVNFKVAAPSKGYAFGFLSWRSGKTQVTSPLVVHVATSDLGLAR